MPSSSPSDPLVSHRDWRTHAAWALSLIARLCDEAPDRHARKQRFIDALATHFNCHVILTTSDRRTEKESERFTSPKVSARSFVEAGDVHISNVLDLPGDRRATLTLRRPVESVAFTTLEAEWIELVHAGCAWIYAPTTVEAGRRLVNLSPREREALGHLMRGASEKEVAALLGRSRHTVHSYVKRIYRTLGVRSRIELRSIFGESAAGQNATDQSLTTSDE